MEGRDQMQPTTAGKLTSDAFLKLPGIEDDGRRHELIDGEHVVTPSPATVHQRLVGELYLALAEIVRASDLGEVFLGPFDVVLSNHDVLEPDLLVVLEDQAEIVTGKHVRGAPAVVIEVLSPGTRRRDLTTKRAIYARSGVREYWIVDPEARSVRVCRWRAGRESVDDRTAGAGGILVSELLPGLEIDLSGLFARAHKD
jgi:Uma2 family endonuclease